MIIRNTDTKLVAIGMRSFRPGETLDVTLDWLNSYQAQKWLKLGIISIVEPVVKVETTVVEKETEVKTEMPRSAWKKKNRIAADGKTRGI